MDSTLVMVRKHSSATKFLARVEHVAHDWFVQSLLFSEQWAQEKVAEVVGPEGFLCCPA
jgi:hypothetical protein